MKNVHKIRGKREFLFDDKELIVLGGGALIICALIFVLGFLIGQDLQKKSVASPLGSEEYMSKEELPPEDREISTTAVATESTSLEDPMNEKEPKLAYYQVLPDSETVVEVEPTPASKTVSTTPVPKESQPEKTNTEISQQTTKKEPAVQPAAPASKSAPQERAVASALPNVPKSPNDVMRVGRQPSRQAERTPLTGTIYSVQVASSRSIRDSERLQQKYMNLGYEAHVMTADLGERGIWYRVRVGNLGSREEAERLKQEILNEVPKLANQPYVIKVD